MVVGKAFLQRGGIRAKVWISRSGLRALPRLVRLVEGSGPLVYGA